MKPLHHRLAVRAAAGAVALLAVATAGTLSGSAVAGSAPAASSSTPAPTSVATKPTLPGGYRHLVVIYEENHSFDNLYGTWGQVRGQAVDGLSHATAAQKTQVAQDGSPYGCLPQDDVNLTVPPRSDTCQDPAHGISASHFGNAPFAIDHYIKPGDRTCPPEGTFAPNGVLKNSAGAEP